MRAKSIKPFSFRTFDSSFQCSGKTVGQDPESGNPADCVVLVSLYPRPVKDPAKLRIAGMVALDRKHDAPATDCGIHRFKPARSAAIMPGQVKIRA